MKTKTIQVLGDTDVKLNVVSEPIQAGGYYSISSGEHTLAVYTGTAFTGRIYLQGTLASEPTEDDWFNIPLDDCCCKEYAEFPIIIDSVPVSNNSLFIYKFKAVPTFIRVKLDRSYLIDHCPKLDCPTENIYGNLRKVLLIY